MTTKSQLLGQPITANYRPTVQGGVTMTPLAGLPFSRSYLERMRQDPRCRLGLATIKAPVAVVQITVASEDQRVQVWVDRQIKRIWRQELSRCLLMLDYGRSGGEGLWKLDPETQLVELSGMRHVHAWDMQALELRGELWGIRVRGSGDIPVGRSFYLVNDAEFNQFYGRSRLWGAWIPWQEKTGGAPGMGRHGAQDIRRLWFVKNAFNGGMIRHPLGDIDIGGGVVKSCEDYARELLEKMETGGILTLPNTKDTEGNYLWDYVAPTANGDIAGIREFVGDVDTEILEGMEIPSEVLEAQSTGSWAGRTVPFLIFLTKEDSIADNVVTAIDRQLLRPGAEANFGPRVKYSITLKSLIPPDQQQPGGMGGMGGGQEPPAAPGGGGGGGSNLQPYQGPRGGHGMRDPNTGAVQYGQQMSLETVQFAEPEPAQADPWVAYRGPRGGIGWKHQQTGRVIYGQTRPGQRRQRGKAAPTSQQVSETAERAHGFHTGEKQLHHDAVTGEVSRIAQHLRIWEAHDLAGRMGLEVGAKESKTSILAKIEAHLRTKATAGQPQAGGDPRVGVVPTADLHVDPQRFQYKLGVSGPAGVGEELKGVREFNPDLAGVLAVWKDPADGQTYVVNGHHRHELASRLGHPDMLVRYLDAPDAKSARAKGALINIAEGRGTAVDAAKFMRDAGVSPEELASVGVSLTGKVAADAGVLNKLNDKLFDRVARGVLDEQKAIAVAKHLPDHEMQNTLVRLLDKRENEGKDISPKVIEEMAREMAETPTVKKGGDDMFGSYESEESLFVERAEIKAHVRAELARDVNDYLAISSKRHAERVKGAGNVIDPEENRRIADEANRVKNVFSTLVNRKGGISDTINEAAKEYAKVKGKKERDEIRKKATEAVKKAVFEEAGVGQPGAAGGVNDGVQATTGEAEGTDQAAAQADVGASAKTAVQPEAVGTTPEPVTSEAPVETPATPEPEAAPEPQPEKPPAAAQEEPEPAEVAQTPEAAASEPALSDDALTSAVRSAAASLPDWTGDKISGQAWKQHKVPVADLYDHLKPQLGGMSLDDFKQRLLSLHLGGKVEMSRLDLGHSKDVDQINRGEIAHQNATFHAVGIPGDVQAIEKPEGGAASEGAAEPETAVREPHEMTAAEALKAGVDFHKWHNSVVDAFRNEVTAEDDPIYRNLSKVDPDDYKRAQRLMGKEVETGHGDIATLSDVAPDFSHVIVTHPNGKTSVHSMSDLTSLTGLIDRAVEDAKDGSLNPGRAAQIAPYLAKEIIDAKGNLFAKLKEKGVDPMSRGGRVLRDAVAKSIEHITAEKNKPSPERQKAMDRQKQLQAEEDAKGKPTDTQGQLSSLPIGDLQRIGGVMVRRTGQNEYRVETDAGAFNTAGQTADERQAGVVRGDASKIAEHIASVGKQDAMHGRARQDALSRVEGYDEPSFMDSEGMEKARKGFERLPIGAKVVSLEEGTRGRVGEIVTDTDGKRRVKFEGEEGYGSPYVEPIDPRQSWRKPMEKQEGPKQGGMFDEPSEEPEGAAAESGESSPEVLTSPEKETKITPGDEKPSGGKKMDLEREYTANEERPELPAGYVWQTTIKERPGNDTREFKATYKAVRVRTEDEKAARKALSRFYPWEHMAEEIQGDIPADVTGETYDEHQGTGAEKKVVFTPDGVVWWRTPDNSNTRGNNRWITWRLNLTPEQATEMLNNFRKSGRKPAKSGEKDEAGSVPSSGDDKPSGGKAMDRAETGRHGKRLLASAGIQARTRVPGRGLSPNTPVEFHVSPKDLDRARAELEKVMPKDSQWSVEIDIDKMQSERTDPNTGEQK